MEPVALWTIGHSTLEIEELVARLRAHRIGLVADVRRYPASRRHPRFNRETLEASLAEAGVGYRWIPELGGRRRPRPDSRNTAWRDESFRGYADYMETPEFAEAAALLAKLATTARTAVMCAEAVWWRCHRGLIADYFKARGASVAHIVGTGPASEHPFTAAARIVDGELTYENPDLLPFVD